MKHKLSLFLLSPMILSLVGCRNKPVDVVIISGQSNGVGCTWANQIPNSKGQEKYLEYLDGYPEIQIAYNCWTKDWPATGITFYPQNASSNGSFVDVALGQGNGTRKAGSDQ